MVLLSENLDESSYMKLRGISSPRLHAMGM